MYMYFNTYIVHVHNYTDVALLIKNRAKARVCVDREVARATPTPPTPPPPYMHMQADTLLPALK